MQAHKTADLAYWISEREGIRLRREQGFPAPWSNDPLMTTVRYCNIRREDDKVTKWLAANWRPQYHEVWQILLARLINNVPTLETLLPAMHISSLEAVRSQLKLRRERTTIFGSAYTVSTNGRSMDKVNYIIDYVVRPAKKWIPTYGPCASIPTLAETCESLCEQLNGVSTFMAGQIIADLKNTEGHPLQHAPDWHTWAAPGPGSLRGLEAYFGRRVPPSGFTAALALCWHEVRPLLPDYAADLHMQDLQNCLCEFSKYMRVKDGGHARNRYTAPAGHN